MKYFLLIVVLNFSFIVAQSSSVKRVDQLIEQLPTAQSVQKCRIARELGQLSNINAVPHLTNLLSDDSLMVRYSAIAALGEIGPQASLAIPKLIEFVQKESAPAYIENTGLKYIRKAAIKAIGQMEKKAATALPALLQLVPTERGTLITSPELNVLCKIGHICSSEVVSELIGLVRHNDAKKKLSSRENLALFLFSHATISYREKYRVPFVEKAKVHFHPLLIPKLLTCCQDKRLFVKKRALKILRSISNLSKTAAPIIEEFLTSEDQDLRQQAVYTLVEMGQEVVYPHLIALLEEKDNKSKRAGLEVLGNIHHKNAMLFLQSLVKKSDVKIRVQAIAALLTIDFSKNKHLIVTELLPLIINASDDVEGYIGDIFYDYKKFDNDTILAMIKEPNRKIRHYVLYIIREQQYEDYPRIISDQRTIPYLLAILDDCNYRTTWNILLIFYQMKEHAAPAIPYLKKMFYKNYHKEDYESESRKICEIFYRIGKKAQPMIAEILFSKDHKMRQYAIPADYITFTPEQCTWVVPMLLKAYKKEDTTSIIYILEALQGIDSPEKFAIIPNVISRLGDRTKYDDSETMGDVISRRIVNFGVVALPELRKILQSEKKDEKLLTLALDSVSRILRYEDDIFPKEMISTLFDVLGNDNVQVRLGAIEAISEALSHTKNSYLQKLIAIAKNDSSTKVRRAAIRAIGKDSQAGNAIKFLIKMLQNEKCKMTAVETLGGLDTKAQEALPSLKELLSKTKKTKHKKLIGKALIRIQNKLLLIKDDPDEWLSFLKKLQIQDRYDLKYRRIFDTLCSKGADLVPVLMAVLEQERLYENRRYYAAEILSKVDARLALPTLLEVLEEQYQKDYFLPKDIARGACGTSILRVFQEYYFGKGLQRAIVISLGNIGKDASLGLPMMEHMQNDKHEEVRRAVLQSIYKIKNER
ncbi:HEAT repeat domain-containing protein [Candidatus Uabimicrobium sp. HlEnr_7]|uniref:HEAT repeat domain-containing protein n=1 Tax=Candidatus Uabimicrobium helgolandensis TaxID=3095367 RepID=UPI003557E3F1